MNTETRIKALTLAIGEEDVEPRESKYDDRLFEIGSREYLVLTDEEAEEQASTYIIDTLWAFSPRFLAGATDIEEDVYKALQANGKCEDNNPTILNLVKKTCGIKFFVHDAIQEDGRGQFISHYDGEELEQRIDNTTFYIYRLN